jgi:hypothetical protein
MKIVAQRLDLLFAELVYDPLPPEPVPLPPELLPADPLLPGPVVPDPVPLELEPPPGLDLEPVAPPLLFAASPPVPDVFLSSEQPGNVIPSNPANMIAVPNEVPFLMSPPLLGSHRYARSIKSNAYAIVCLTILRGVNRTARLKLAVQGGSVE